MAETTDITPGIVNNGDSIDPEKVQAHKVAEEIVDIVKDKHTSSVLKTMLIIQAVVLLILMGALAGMAGAVIYYAKHIEVQGGVLVSTKTGEAIRFQSAELYVTSAGILVSNKSRSDGSIAPVSLATNSTSPNYSVPYLNAQPSGRRSLQQQQTAGNRSAPARIVPVSTSASDTPLGLHSALPMSTLQQLKYIQVNSSSGAELSIHVQAVAKMPAPFSDGAYTTCEVLKIVTYIGTITVHGTVMEFENNVGDIFREAGFIVEGTGRRRMLARNYGLTGYFNYIKDLQVTNILASDSPQPYIATIFQMKMRVMIQCADPSDTTSDKCTGPDNLDLPGTVLLGGVRYMSTTVSVARQNDSVLTTIEYPNHGPNITRNELLNRTSGLTYVWQDLYQGTRQTHCETFTVSAVERDVVTNLLQTPFSSFQFIGYESKLGVSTRHFSLATSQPLLAGQRGTQGMPYKVDNLTMDLWDTAENGDICSTARNNYPVAMEISHPSAGKVKIEVLAFSEDIIQPAALFSVPATFNDRTPAGCPGPQYTKVPKIGSAWGPAWTPPPVQELDSLFKLYTNVTVTSLNPDILQGLMIAFDASTSNNTNASSMELLRNGFCRGSITADDTTTSFTFNVTCTGYIFEYMYNGLSLLKLNGPISASMSSAAKALFSGCVSIGTDDNGMDLLLRALGGPALRNTGDLYALPPSLSIKGFCLSYDATSGLGLLNGYGYQPNTMLARVEWGSSMELDFEECLASRFFTARGTLAFNFVWGTMPLTIFDRTLFGSSGCPVTNTSYSGSDRLVWFKSAFDSKYVSIPDGPQFNGKRLAMTNNQLESNLFHLEYLDGGGIVFRADGGKLMQPVGAAFTDGVSIELWSDVGSTKQQWETRPYVDNNNWPVYRILHKQSQKCLHAGSGSLQLSACASEPLSPPQLWYLDFE